MVKKYVYLFLIIQLAFSTICNAQAYTINHFQSTYDTLTSYNSLSLELLLAGEYPNQWEEDFVFGFSFPFFGTMYDTVTLDSDATGFFPGSPNYNFYMFTGTYTIADILDTTYLESEIRYTTTTTTNNLQALVVEYHNIYDDYEYLDNGPNHFLNFQIWFYENGIIELQFGDIDLTNDSYYFPGQGFSFDNQNPNGNIYGPWISINNNDITEGACFSNDHTNPTILYDDDANCDVITSIPPSGFVVQFLPSNLTALDEVNEVAKDKFQLNEQYGIVEVIGEMDAYKSSTVFDLMGRKINYTTDNKFSFPSGNNPQIYLVVIESELGQETHKLLSK